MQDDNIISINIDDLIIGLGSRKRGFIATYYDLLEHRFSNSYNAPIKVCWLEDEGGFLVTDGYHRIMHRLISGQTNFLCEVDWKGYTTKWYVPKLHERFNRKMIPTLQEFWGRDKPTKIVRFVLEGLIRQELHKKNLL